MPHKQKHRGPRPEDYHSFGPDFIPVLKAAVFDHAFLRSRGYSEDAIMKMVGDRYQLQKRQRMAVMRSACSIQSLEDRNARWVSLDDVYKHPLYIDGFNLLITIESALSGGMIFEGMDGSYRDLSSIHASYKRVEETYPAIKLIGDYLESNHSSTVHWLLDSPVSNSGRLKQYLIDTAEAHGWPWEAALVKDPDNELKNKQEGAVVTSGGVILDRACYWFNLSKSLLYQKVPDFWHIDLKVELECIK